MPRSKGSDDHDLREIKQIWILSKQSRDFSTKRHEPKLLSVPIRICINEYSFGEAIYGLVERQIMLRKSVKKMIHCILRLCMTVRDGGSAYNISASYSHPRPILTQPPYNGSPKSIKIWIQICMLQPAVDQGVQHRNLLESAYGPFEKKNVSVVLNPHSSSALR